MTSTLPSALVPFGYRQRFLPPHGSFIPYGTSVSAYLTRLIPDRYQASGLKYHVLHSKS